jgi:hypothetical protein
MDGNTEAELDRLADGHPAVFQLMSIPAVGVRTAEAVVSFLDDPQRGVRSGRWKLHFPHGYRSLAGPGGSGGRPAPYEERRIELALFDLDAEPGETQDVAGEHPEVVARLQALAESARDDLANSSQADSLPQFAGVSPSADQAPGSPR